MSLRPLAVALALAAVGCASSPDRRPETTPDRTHDPEFEAARDASQPEFETQAEALAAGVYEPFVHPDSVGPSLAEGPTPTTPRERGDPSTAELLGTLGQDVQYNRRGGDVPRGNAAAGRTPAPGVWTLQTGAYGSETGALVRERELERAFPDLPVWHVSGGDGLVRVYLGRFAERDAAELALARLAARGYADAWVVRAP